MSIKRRLYTIEENEAEEFLSKRWEDFDHSQQVLLGVQGFTWTVRDKTTSERYVLQSCPKSEWDRARHYLLELSRQRIDLFVTPRFLFARGDRVYVCSEIAGISLAEVIDGTLNLTELHAGEITRQVIKGLQALAAMNIIYNVKASNVFIAGKPEGNKETSVRLAGFGQRLRPKFIGQRELGSCESIGHLVYHMLTRMPRIPGDDERMDASEQMITIRTKSVNIPIKADHQFSSVFFDFIESCMGGGCTLDALSNHIFLRQRAQLGALARHAHHTSVLGSRWDAIERTDEGEGAMT